MPAFVLPGGVGFCNAVRRTLLSDVTAWAPCEVTMHDNGTCYTDEFLAHRIGLIPFRRLPASGVLTATVDATGPGTVRAGDLVSPGVEAVHPDVEVAALGSGHRLNLTVHFDCQPARVHARYAACAAVGMEKIDRDHCRLSFEVNDGRDARDVLREALDAFDARVERALHALAHQPAEPPKSYC